MSKEKEPKTIFDYVMPWVGVSIIYIDEGVMPAVRRVSQTIRGGIQRTTNLLAPIRGERVRREE